MLCFLSELLIILLFTTPIDTIVDEGVGLEDPEDPGYIADQGKQPFDHV